MGAVRRALVGSIVGIALSVGLAAAMVPFRSHLSIATAALVFVLPVVAGVITGGFPAGVASVVAGFIAYDYGFVPPYNRLRVEHAQDWVALAVYAVVMMLVSRVSPVSSPPAPMPRDGPPTHNASSVCRTFWWRIGRWRIC